MRSIKNRIVLEKMTSVLVLTVVCFTLVADEYNKLYCGAVSSDDTDSDHGYENVNCAELGECSYWSVSPGFTWCDSEPADDPEDCAYCYKRFTKDGAVLTWYEGTCSDEPGFWECSANWDSPQSNKPCDLAYTETGKDCKLCSDD